MNSETPVPETLSEADIAFLSEYLNPVYLQSRTMKTLASRFVEESSLELHSFLCNDLAEALEHRLPDADAKDGLGPDRAGKIPPHSAGVSSSSPWCLKGPPHKWRYCTLAPLSPNDPVTSITPLSAHPSPSEILRAIQDDLFPSPPFRNWLTIVSRLLPLRYSVEARRFRPGLDYTLATSEESEARLDVVLGMTPDVQGGDGSVAANGKNKGGKFKAEPPRGWSAAEWGGWEVNSRSSLRGYG
jgi:prolyl 3-hydroxylase /prolyl 3,4-dihydroxylase